MYAHIYVASHYHRLLNGHHLYKYAAYCYHPVTKYPMSTKNRTILLRFILPSICASLGTWQILRWQKKRHFLEELEAKINSEPLKIESVQELEQVPFSKYEIIPKSTGQRALLGPRGLGAPLYYGYTLFESVKLPSGETVVLNRGNLSLDSSNQPIPSLNDTVVVVKDKEESKPLFALKNTQDRILWKDWRILKQALNIPPTENVQFLKIISSDYDPVRNHLIHEHKLKLDQIPNRHLEYIATWYSLAAFSFLMSFMRK